MIIELGVSLVHSLTPLIHINKYIAKIFRHDHGLPYLLTVSICGIHPFRPDALPKRTPYG